MKFKLDKQDLNTAVRNYLATMDVPIEGKKVEITFRVGRANRFGTSETYAEVDVTSLDPGTISAIPPKQLDLDL